MKRFIAILTLTLCALPAQAQDSLRLEDVIEKVRAYNPDLKSKMIEKKIAKYTKREALGQALPQISAKVTHMQNFNVPKFDIPGMGTFQMQGDYAMEYGATVTQAIYTFGAVSAAVRAADKLFTMVEVDVDAARNNVDYQAKMAFYQVLLAQRLLEINQAMLKNAQDNLSILRNNFRGGRPPQQDLLMLQTDAESKKPAVENAKAELKAAKIALNILMGEDPNKEFSVVGKLRSNYPTYSAPHLQTVLVKESPTLKYLEQSSEYQLEVANVRKSLFMPKLGLFYNFNRLDQSYNDRFDRDQTLTTSALGIGLNWNIWDGGISHTAYQKAKASAEQSQLTLQKTQDQMSQQIFASLEQFNTYKKNISTLENASDLAQRSFQLSQKKLRSGQTSITELNGTQSALLMAQMQQATNLFQLNITHALIESLIGKDLK